MCRVTGKKVVHETYRDLVNGAIPSLRAYRARRGFGLFVWEMWEGPCMLWRGCQTKGVMHET